MSPLADDSTSTYWNQQLTSPQGPVGDHITNVFWPVFWVSVVVFVGVSIAILYSALRFRRQSDDDDEPEQVHGNSRLELAWTLIPFVILISLFVVTAVNMRVIADTNRGPNALHVCVQGQRFNWTYFYENGCGDSHVGQNPESRDYTPDAKSGTVVDANELVIPTGRPVELELVSADVNHSYFIPEIAGQLNVIPGQKNHLWIQVDNPGTYHGACTELCGNGHSGMLVVIKAMNPKDYATWCTQAKQKAGQRAGGSPTGSGGCD